MNANGRQKNGEKKKLNIILDNAQMSKTHSLHEYVVPYITNASKLLHNLLQE